MSNALLEGARRLRAYIYSGTKIIPEDAEKYRYGQEFGEHCVFCGRYALDYPVMNQGIDTWTKMCKHCNEEVKKELPVYMSKDEYYNREIMLLNSLSRGYEFHIPEPLHFFYSHLDGSKKDYFAGDKPQRCFICQRLPDFPEPYNDEEEFERIEIPVRSSEYIIGGKVHICNDNYCKKVTNSYNSLLDGLGYNNAAKARDVNLMLCPSCRNEYYVVGDDELAYRVEHEGELEWLCPSCSYKQLGDWEVSGDLQKYYPGSIGEPRKELLTRFVDCECTMCKQRVVIDYCQTEFSFFLNNVYAEQLVCRPCSLLRTWFDHWNVFRIEDTNMFLELGDDHTFSIYSLEKGNLSFEIDGNTGMTNNIDTLIVAYAEAVALLEDILKNGR